MLDFAALPPEINSARMYSGPGAGSLTAAAAEWHGLAATLESQASETSALVAGLDGAWQGSAADEMTAKMAQHTSWLTQTAAVAARTAIQANAAAAAYQEAFAATVNPALIAYNRAELYTLCATNILGQNTAAIMANEAEYSEMWAQDVSAMTTYSASSAQATTLQSFPQPAKGTQPVAPPTATASGTTYLNFLDETFQSFVSSGPYEAPLALLAMFNVLWAVGGENSPLAQAFGGKTNVNIPPPATQFTTPAKDFRRNFGTVGRVGGTLSVPPQWASQLAKTEAVTGATRFVPFGTSVEAAPMGVMPMAAGGQSAEERRPQPRYGQRVTVLPKGI
jgi:PPE-repeat protein